MSSSEKCKFKKKAGSISGFWFPGSRSGRKLGQDWQPDSVLLVKQTFIDRSIWDKIYGTVGAALNIVHHQKGLGRYRYVVLIGTYLYWNWWSFERGTGPRGATPSSGGMWASVLRLLDRPRSLSRPMRRLAIMSRWPNTAAKPVLWIRNYSFRIRKGSTFPVTKIL